MNLLNIKNKTTIFEYLKFVIYIPAIILKIKNWWNFLYLYSNGFSGLLHFRNGFKILAENASDASSISTSFFRKDYGKINADTNTIVDIGAHKGYFSLYCAVNSPKCVIYSLEPIIENFSVLEKNIRQNKLEDRVILINMACTGSSGFCEINVGPNSTDNSLYNNSTTNFTEKRKIECISLNDLFVQKNIEYADILKLDCEGAEFEILLNASDTTLSKIGQIRMEFHKDLKGIKHNIDELRDFLEKKSFALKKLDNNRRLSTGYAWFVK